ncbi:hypothetical protein Ahy_B02g058692 [Arachis hypogaea]|uniref:Uncharacterized protein n=1 Tax=Arachis hypogaea TaxID=3818 RepID=A0A445AF52_ARAHY|nr:hypothetical protein Ahy_B02g058692 [Arachis hypogaea]
MFSMYIETRSQMSFIKLNIEEKFESNYKVNDLGEDEDQANGTMKIDVTKVTNALTNQHSFKESSFMRTLDLENMDSLFLWFAMEMEFSFRKVVITTMKDYTIHRGVDYRDYSKLNSNIIVEAIKSLVEVDPSIKVKSVIVEFNYIISYHKAWLAKRQTVKNFFGGRVTRSHHQPSILKHACVPGDDLVLDIWVLHRVFWSSGTYLYGKYKSCLLVVISQDGNNDIVHIAFAIVAGETSDA